MNIRILQTIKRKAEDHSFLLLTLAWYFILQRMDSLVCPRLEFDLRLILNWWIFMPILVTINSLIIYRLNPKKNLHRALLFLLCYPGMVLDIMYIFEVPFPNFIMDPNFVWFWHPAKMIFNYNWTVKEQIIYWIISFTCLGIYYYKKVKLNERSS